MQRVGWKDKGILDPLFYVDNDDKIESLKEEEMYLVIGIVLAFILSFWKDNQSDSLYFSTDYYSLPFCYPIREFFGRIKK